MIRESAAIRVKEIVAFAERIEEIVQERHRRRAGALEAVNPSVESIWLPHQERIIRSKCRIDPEPGCGCRYRSMMA